MKSLEDFQIHHSAFGQFVILSSSFIDTSKNISRVDGIKYSDEIILIRIKDAKGLIKEIKKHVDYIDAGIEESKEHYAQ